MERLGFWGIIKLTTYILLRNLHHFLCISLLLALSQALNFIVEDSFEDPFEKVHQHSPASITMLYKFSSSQAGALDPSNLTPSEKSVIANQQQHSPPRFPRLPVSILSSSMLLVCTILVTFSVCRECLNKSVDLKGSLRGVPRSAKNLVLTWLFEFGVVLMLVLLAVLGTVIIPTGLSAVKVNLGIPITIITAIGVVGGLLYMEISWSLASTVAILEEKKGWEAISKSEHLIKGSRWIAVGLKSALYGVMIVVALPLTFSEDASVVWRWVAGGVSVCLQAFVLVFSLVSTVVLYMSCKSGKEESVETLLAASSEFGPPDSAPQYLDLETAAFATSTQ